MIRQYRYSIGRPADGCINSTFMRPAIYDTSTGCEDPMETLNIRISVRNPRARTPATARTKSPEIDVGGVNVEHSKCLAIICNDPDAPGGGGFIHWIAWNIELAKLIPEKIPKDPTVTFPIKAVQGINSFGTIGYSGPCPPHGQTHRYFFKIYGLDMSSTLHPVPLKMSFYEAWAGMLSSTGETYVTYGR